MGTAAQEIDDLLVDVAAVVVPQVEDERILVEHFRMHLQQERIEVFVAHRTHVDVSDPVAGLLLHHVGTLLLPLLVREGLEGGEGRGVDLGVELLAAAAERELQLFHRHGARGVLLPVRGLVHPHAVHGDQFIPFLHVDPEPVGRGIRQDARDLVRRGVVEEDARAVAADPGFVLLLGAGGVESQVGRVQLAQQVGDERTEIGPRPHVRKERGIVIPHRRPVRAVEADIVVVLLQDRPGFIEHLPEFVVQHRLHVFLDLGLGGGCGGRVDLVDGARGQAVQRILAAEEGASAQVLDLLGLRVRVRNLQGEDARGARTHGPVQEVVLPLDGEDVRTPLEPFALHPGHPFVDVLEVDHDRRILLRLVLLVLEQAFYVFGLERGVVFPERKLVERGPGPPGERSGGQVGQQVHVFPVGREHGALLHGGGTGEVPQAPVLEIVEEDVRVEHMHRIECQPVAVVREGEVIALERPELRLGHLDRGARLHVVQHHGAAPVDEGQLLAFPVRLQAFGVVLRAENGRFGRAPVGRDAVEVRPAPVRPRVIEGLAVRAPDHFVHPLVRRGFQFPEILAFRVGDVQPPADDQGELLPVGRYVRRGGRLSFERTPDPDAAGSDPDLRDRHLRRGRLQDVDLIVLQEHDGRSAERDGRILDRLVEGGELLRLPALHVTDDVGFLVQLVADVVDIAVAVGHRPLVLADVVGQFRVGPGARIPALDVGIVVAHIAFPGGETDAFHRLVEEEFPCLGILREVDHGVEIAVEHQLGRAARHGHLEGGLAGAGAGGLEVDPVRLGRPAHRRVRRFVEGQLDGLPARDGNDIDVVVPLDVGAESQPSAVRRNEGRVLHPGHRDDGRGLTALHGDGKDVAVIAEVDLLPVRGKRRVRSEADVVRQAHDGGGRQRGGQKGEFPDHLIYLASCWWPIR